MQRILRSLGALISFVQQYATEYALPKAAIAVAALQAKLAAAN